MLGKQSVPHCASIPVLDLGTLRDTHPVMSGVQPCVWCVLHEHAAWYRTPCADPAQATRSSCCLRALRLTACHARLLLLPSACFHTTGVHEAGVGWCQLLLALLR